MPSVLGQGGEERAFPPISLYPHIPICAHSYPVMRSAGAMWHGVHPPWHATSRQGARGEEGSPLSLHYFSRSDFVSQRPPCFLFCTPFQLWILNKFSYFGPMKIYSDIAMPCYLQWHIDARLVQEELRLLEVMRIAPVPAAQALAYCDRVHAMLVLKLRPSKC